MLILELKAYIKRDSTLICLDLSKIFYLKTDCLEVGMGYDSVQNSYEEQGF